MNTVSNLLSAKYKFSRILCIDFSNFTIDLINTLYCVSALLKFTVIFHVKLAKLPTSLLLPRLGKEYQ